MTARRRGGEDLATMWRQRQRAWELLRRRKGFDGIVGGVRVIECVWSKGHRKKTRPGWHLHYHLVLVTSSDEMVDCPVCSGSGRRSATDGRACKSCGGVGTWPADVAEAMRVWCDPRLNDAELAGQCCVDLDEHRVGQLCKYLTKMWELPSRRAVELFDVAEHKRLINGFGIMRDWHAIDEVEDDGPWMVGPSVASLERIEDDGIASDDVVTFVAKINKWERTVPGRGGGKATIVEYEERAHVTAAQLLADLRRDPRPTWAREGIESEPRAGPG